jgi:hypothetical protein
MWATKENTKKEGYGNTIEKQRKNNNKKLKKPTNKIKCIPTLNLT